MTKLINWIKENKHKINKISQKLKLTIFKHEMIIPRMHSVVAADACTVLKAIRVSGEKYLTSVLFMLFDKLSTTTLVLSASTLLQRCHFSHAHCLSSHSPPHVPLTHVPLRSQPLHCYHRPRTPILNLGQPRLQCKEEYPIAKQPITDWRVVAMAVEEVVIREFITIDFLYIFKFF